MDWTDRTELCPNCLQRVPVEEAHYIHPTMYSPARWKCDTKTEDTMTEFHHFTIAHNMIVTANTDESIPLNSKVLATIDGDVHGDHAEVKNMIHRANTQPDLLRALVELLDEIAGLEGVELTRNVEPHKAEACWGGVINYAERVVTEAKGIQS